MWRNPVKNLSVGILEIDIAPVCAIQRAAGGGYQELQGVVQSEVLDRTGLGGQVAEERE
jgi:hypothetical protein